MPVEPLPLLATAAALRGLDASTPLRPRLGLAADVRMLVGNGYVPGHADLALGLIRRNDPVRVLFEARLAAEA